jgi:hypothetical protein
VVGFFAASSFAVPQAEAQPEPAPQLLGISVGARTGWAIPFGYLSRGEPMSSNFRGMFPLGIDAVYRLDRRFDVGAYLQYGLVSVAPDICPAPLSCSAHDVRFGVSAHWHFLATKGSLGEGEGDPPPGSFDPWIGIGFGYEIATIALSLGGDHASRSYRGFELGRFEVGLDYLAAPRLRLGVFVDASMDQFTTAHQEDSMRSGNFSIQGTGVHGWTVPGIRLRYDF